jgi:cytochrome P450
VNKPILEFDHHSPEFARHDRAEIRRVQETCPVAYSESHGGFWLVSRWDDINRMAKDYATFSSENDHGAGPRQGVSLPPSGAAGGLVETDPPRHSAIRRAANPWFTPARVRELAPAIRTDADYLIDQFIERGEVEFVSELIGPLPGLIVLRMLGLPTADYQRYSALIRTQYTSPDSPERPEVDQVLAAIAGELLDYARLRRSEPKNDYLSFLAGLEVDGEPLTIEEVGSEALLLLAAGLDTTTTLLGHTICHLSEHPDDLAWLAEDPDERLETAREEILRYYTPVTALARTATADVEVRGEQISAGDPVLLWWQSGNEDPDAFERPEQIRLDRTPNPHLSFGAGPHRCLGRHLARLEWDIVMRQILSRMPDVRVVSDGVRRYPDQQSVSGFIDLPAEFTPGPRVGAVLHGA